jgi:hypothetical protein
MPSQTRKAGRVRSYKIHDNGGRPFVVDVNEHQKKLSISVSYADSKTGLSLPPVHFKDYAFKRIWIGDDVFHYGKKMVGWDPKWKGNSILAQLSANRFLEIGKEIFEFTLMAGDAPVAYSSYVGNSDVPYPYLVGKTHTYLMIEDVAIPNEVLDMKQDAYGQYYGHLEGSAHVAASAKKFKKKMIHKRVW